MGRWCSTIVWGFVLGAAGGCGDGSASASAADTALADTALADTALADTALADTALADASASDASEGGDDAGTSGDGSALDSGADGLDDADTSAGDASDDGSDDATSDAAEADATDADDAADTPSDADAAPDVDLDRDDDRVLDEDDNCPEVANAAQRDTDSDGRGDACDPVLFDGLRDDALRTALVTLHRSTHSDPPLSYNDVRPILFSEVDNDEGRVEDVYTGVVIETEGLPEDGALNVEHSWPQSEGAGEPPMQSDAHHLFPVERVANSTRNNLPFCAVVSDVSFDAGGSRKGRAENNRLCFEVRDAHKGDVARAMFYFSVVYEEPLDAFQEDTLRAWHAAHPADEADASRNERVERLQGSRNLFVEDPTLVERIANF